MHINIPVYTNLVRAALEPKLYRYWTKMFPPAPSVAA